MLASSLGAGGNSSGDLFLFFATGNRGMGVTPEGRGTRHVHMLDDGMIDEFFHAVIEATEEAVLNSMLASSTMTGRNGATVHALPHDQLVEILTRGWSPFAGQDARG